MIRRSTILWLVLVAVLGFAMFKVKYRVMQLEDELARTDRQITADQHAIRVLKAEWSYLSQPSRLAELNQRFLGLVPIATKQLGRIETLPMRPAAAPPALTAAPPPPAGHEGGTRLANARQRVPQ